MSSVDDVPGAVGEHGDGISKAQNIQRLIQEYPPCVEIDTKIATRRTLEPGKNVLVPYYAAGFFLEPNWFWGDYLYRNQFQRGREAIAYLKRDPEAKKLLHPTTAIIPQNDIAGHSFFILCSNYEAFKRDRWLENPNACLEAVCKRLKFTERETEQAKKAFKWYIINPRVYDRVPEECAVRG